MKTIITLMLGMLFGIQSLCAQILIEPTQKELLKALITIRNAGPEKSNVHLHSAVAAALIDLDYGDLTTLRGNKLSEQLILYFNFGVDKGGNMKMSALKAAAIVNHLMTQKIEPVRIYQDEITPLVFEIEEAIVNLAHMQKKDEYNLGIKHLEHIFSIATDILKDENPSLHVDTKTINTLRWAIPIVEQWGFKGASKSVSIAVAMAANKCSFIDEKKPTETKVSTKSVSGG